MEEKKSQVIEAEVLDENGLPVAQDTPRERGREFSRGREVASASWGERRSRRS